MNDVYMGDDGYWYFDDEDDLPQGPFEDEDEADVARVRYLQTL